jgi:hypothetical protein
MMKRFRRSDNGRLLATVVSLDLAGVMRSSFRLFERERPRSGEHGCSASKLLDAIEGNGLDALA